MKMFIGGQWVDRDDKIEVLNPFDGSVLDTVPRASNEDVDTALATAVRGAEIMAKIPAYERYQILHRASEIITERLEELDSTL